MSALMDAVSVEYADEFIAMCCENEKWRELTPERKRGALSMAARAIGAGMYRLPEELNDDIRAAICLEACARADDEHLHARKMRAMGVTSASAGHAKQDYAANGGTLWDSSARALLKPYALKSARLYGTEVRTWCTWQTP